MVEIRRAKLIYKEYEEIRKDVGASQKSFAEMLGISYRSYCYRIVGKFLEFATLNEIVKLAELNGGQCRIGDYNIDIHKV